MERIAVFDGIRAVAILGIVACHVCYAIGWNVIGQYLGGTFNVIFFMLSAILLGLSVNKAKTGGDSLNYFSFIIKRIIRLESSLLPFLLSWGIVFIITGTSFTVKAFLENVFMLGWFAKLPGLGHL